MTLDQRPARRRPARVRGLASAVALAFAAFGATAHDSWFAPFVAPSTGTERLLVLGTGNRFPAHESGIDHRYLARQGCSHRGAAPQPMAALRDLPTALLLRLPEALPRPASCWAQLVPIDIEVPLDKVDLYFDEVRPPDGIRLAWEALNARGLSWQERYTKHARIELPGPPQVGERTTLASGMDVDVLTRSARLPVRTGDELEFQLLKRGEALPGQPVEVLHERMPQGLWLRTDGDGRVRFAPTRPGRWLLRSIELRLAPGAPDRWESDFVTLAFSVVPADRGGSGSRLSAR